MPAPHEIPAGLSVTVVDHPLAASRLSIMRDARHSPPFRAAVHELTMMLVYEAGADVAGRADPAAHPGREDHGGAAVQPPAAGAGVACRALGMANQAH